MPSDADDQLVWSIPSGAVLSCCDDLVMEGSGEVAFSRGVSYRVVSMHPIADPPFVMLINDQRQRHRLQACDLRQYFGR